MLPSIYNEKCDQKLRKPPTKRTILFGYTVYKKPQAAI